MEPIVFSLSTLSTSNLSTWNKCIFDLLLDKNRKAHPKDKKTDWFYKNEQYDRKLDDRADKNNYRTL